MTESPNGTTSAADNGIEATGLVREFKGGVRAVDGIDLEVAARRDLRLPRPERRRQVHHRPHADHPAAPHRRHRAGRRLRRRHRGRPGPRRDRRRASGGRPRPAADRAASTCASRAPSTACPRRSATPRGDELIERVGLTDAADRKVGGYSGGMKRRLDLALALLHGPRVLFLDEPTTGLDIQSRTALWDEVARLSRDEGVTVFLTTQYLEEADQLAERVGIIDQGKIVAEGTPAALKAEVGRPTVEAVPADHGERERVAERARPLRGARPRDAQRAPRSASTTASRSWPRSSAPSTRRGSGSRTSSSTPPASTTSSSPRPAARSRAPRPRPSEARPASSRPSRRRRLERDRHSAGGAPLCDPDPGARAALDPAHPAPAGGDRPGDPVPADPARDQLGRASTRRPTLPGFPTDSYVTFALAFAFLQAGVFAVIGTGQNLAEDTPERLLQPHAADPDPPARRCVAGQLAGTLALGLLQARHLHRGRAARRRPHRGRHPRRAGADRARDADHARLRLDRAGRRACARARPRTSRASSR